MIEKIPYIIFDKFNILLKVNEHIRSVLLFILFILFSLSASFGSVSPLLIAFSLNSRFLSLIVIFFNLLNEYYMCTMIYINTRSIIIFIIENN